MRKIIKRDGRIVNFNDNKITIAIKKAAQDAKVALSDDELDDLTDKVVSHLEAEFDFKDKKPGVEDIQDMVEKTLTENNMYEVVRAYIIYREDRARKREMKSDLMKTYNELTFGASKDVDLKRENGNINGETAMGKMLRYGSEGAKQFSHLYLMDEDISKAHKRGDIHIHDLDFMSTGTLTCCQIDLDHLFEKGFNTGEGFIRTPNSIQSYASLACIVIQANQNDQHGGQSIPLYDYYLAPGVAKTFIKNFCDIVEIKYDLDMSEVKEKMRDFMQNNGRRIINEKGKEFTKEITSNLNIDFDKCWHKAYMKTNKDTYQSQEAVVHNLNTLHSRAGSQVPFSSINFGTDISEEGRMVSLNLLYATEAGLGNGETPIFPISILKVKEGVNYNPGDPNYDIFKESIKCSAKRLFPNFVFIDAPHNIQYYKPGHPETEAVAMGCVDGKEVISYKIDGNLYVEGFERAWNRISKIGNVETFGVSEYVNTENLNVLIMDSFSGGFIKVKKFIKNPNMNNWKQIKLSNGRNLLATSDHPLPTLERGRTAVIDIEVGDHIPVVSAVKYDMNANNEFDIDMAWLLGVLICDSSYDSSVCISLGLDETDIIEKINKVAKENGFYTVVKEQNRGEKGHYYDVFIRSNGVLKDFITKLENLFGGKQKEFRSIPKEVFSASHEVKCAFIAGMIDADGYIQKHFDDRAHNTYRGQLGSTNKELAIQQMQLIQSIGCNAKIFLNKYNSQEDKYRYKVEFEFCDFDKYMVSSKKKETIQSCEKAAKINISEYAEVISIEDVVNESCSYDVETESDRFDVSGIYSHNCRTRVMGNTYNPDHEVVVGRGNLSFTSINLPRLGIRAKGDINKFYKLLDEKLDLVHRQLLQRMKIQGSFRVKNFPFLMGQGLWLGSEKLNPEDTLEEVVKEGTLSIGFIGLAETLVALIGHHHGESEEAQKLGLEIIKHMRDYTDKLSEETKLNWSLLATPAEGLSGRFVKMDRKRFGVIPGVTDKDWYTNSSHVPVEFEISAADKIRIEAPYHALENAGHIAYIEMDGDPTQNLDAFEKIVRYMKECGVGYGAINHPVDRDPICGFTGIINDECPLCHRHEFEGIDKKKLDDMGVKCYDYVANENGVIGNGVGFNRLRRITGYLVGTLDRFNDAKYKETMYRKKHL